MRRPNATCSIGLLHTLRLDERSGNPDSYSKLDKGSKGFKRTWIQFALDMK
jgi:hypothetical protein